MRAIRAETQEKPVCVTRKRVLRGRSGMALTGCVSNESMVEQLQHAYFDALKDYAVHYAQAQSYLVEEGAPVVHDYTLTERMLAEPDHSMLEDEMETEQAPLVSDEDIDACGYLGWLRH